MSTNLEPSRNSLVHLQVLLGAVHGANLLLLADLPVGEVPNAVAEADLAQLVVVGQEIAEGLDLFSVGGRASSRFPVHLNPRSPSRRPADAGQRTQTSPQTITTQKSANLVRKVQNDDLLIWKNLFVYNYLDWFRLDIGDSLILFCS